MSAAAMITTHSDTALKGIAAYLKSHIAEDWREREWIKERREIVEAELNSRRKAPKP